MRLGITITAVCILASSLPALPQPKPAFDPRAVVRHVRRSGRHRRPDSPRSRPASRHAARPRRPAPALASRPDDGEFLVDTSVVLVPGPYDRTLPAVAFDGTNFLVVWEDDRGFDWCYDIYGARVTPEGMVLDPAGIAISEAVDDQNCPAVGFDGANFLVVWEDWRSGDYQDIYGARVTPEGAVLDPEGLVISDPGSDQYSAAVGFGGGSFLVVWADFRSVNSEDIYGARVTPQGTVLDSAGIAISQATRDQCYPAVGFDGSDFLVVWEEYRNVNGDVYGARVTPQGAVLDTSGIAVSTAANGQYCPALSFVGGNFLVAWEDYRNGSNFEVYGARVTPEGAVLDPSGLAIALANDDQYYVKVGSDSANFLVVWEDNRGMSTNIYCARVTPSGTVLDPSGIDVSQAPDDEYTPAVGFGGGHFLVAWEDYSVGDDIFGARVTPAGTVLDPGGFIISTAPQDQYSPAVAFDGTNFLVVWEDGRSVSWYENYDIYGARVTPAGTVLDPSGFAISQAAGEQYLPAVGFNGTEFLVVWEDYRNGYQGDIYGARVTPQGAVLDTQGIVISQATGSQRSADVGAAGTNFLVVWEDRRGSSYADIYGARVAQQGTVLDPSGITIAQAAYYQSAPAVGSDGTNSLVVWQDNRTGAGWYDILGARVTPEGTVLDSAGIAISQAVYHQQAPDVSFDGTNFLVVWEDIRNAVTWDIYGARVTPEGTVLDSGIAISQADGDQGFPAVGFDDANFLVAWEDFRNGIDWDIYGARVTPAGVVSDTWPVSTQERDQVLLALACGGGGQMLAVYQSWTRTIGGRSYNTHRIWGKLGAFVGVEAGNGLRQASGVPPAATVVRGVLFLPEAPSHEPQAAGLLDVSGRRVLELHTGANDVSRVSPGVYFVCPEPPAARQRPQATYKVVVTR
jgi:phosphoribosylformylglycinamidine (FGAM) synthase PurS component